MMFKNRSSDKSTLEVEILLLLGSTSEFNSHQYGSESKFLLFLIFYDTFIFTFILFLI